METVNIFETKSKDYKKGIKESFPVTGMELELAGE